MNASTKRNLLIGGLAIGTSVAIYKAMNRGSKPVIDAGGNEPSPSGFPLQMGSRGQNVKLLQRFLVSKGGVIAQSINSTGGIDGIWGKGTQRAVSQAGLPNQISQSMLTQLANQKASLPKVVASSAFPLKAGSSGSEVMLLQQYLIKKGGAPAIHIKTTGGADGRWGRGTSSAVKAANLPSTISQTLYTKLVG